MPKLYAVIMAGGRGERFWPLSTEVFPKPFVPLLGPQTLIQETVARLQPLVPRERIFISIGRSQKRVARAQLPELPPSNFLVEPVGRDTSACLAFCALHLERVDPDAVMLALPADHFIGDPSAFQKAMQQALASLDGATGVVFGIAPQRPDSGYGYVRAEKPVREGSAWPVLRFVEKPDLATAEAYVRSGDYFWNSGMFLWRNRTLLGLFEKHMPRTWEGMVRLRGLLGKRGKDDEILEVFSSLERISIDFGILERTTGLRLVPVSFDWDDIGNWGSLARALRPGGAGNVSRGPHVSVDSADCIVYSDAGTVATFGVRDLVVVQANGNVLVCPKNRASDLKRLVAALSPGREK
jgi:mannose-1-phosphate guanylyltransferase